MSSSCHHPFQKRAIEPVGLDIRCAIATGHRGRLHHQRNGGCGDEFSYRTKSRSWITSMILTYLGISRLYMALCHPISRNLGFIWLYGNHNYIELWNIIGTLCLLTYHGVFLVTSPTSNWNGPPCGMAHDIFNCCALFSSSCLKAYHFILSYTV